MGVKKYTYTTAFLLDEASTLDERLLIVEVLWPEGVIIMCIYIYSSSFQHNTT